MADTIKKYLDQAGLESLVTKIKSEDDAHLAEAKSYADGLGKNYDASGSAATAEANAKAHAEAKVKELADGQVNTNKEAIAGIVADYLKAADKTELQGKIDAVDGKADKNAEDIAAINNETTGILALAKADATEKANAVQANVDTVAGDLDKLEEYVGTFTSENAKSVVEYIDEKTSGIASDAVVGALGDRVTQAEKDIDAIEADYLKAEDKTELSDAIALKADQTSLDEVAEVAEAAATKVALQEEVDRAKGEESRIEGLVTAEKERAEGVEAGLQTQINTIMNNPDAEGAINSINEFTAWVSEHGTIAEGMRIDINKNNDNIAAEVKRAGEAESALSGRLDDLEAIDHEAYVAADTALKNELTGEIAKKVDKTVYDAKVEALENADAGQVERIEALEAKFGDGEGNVESQIETAKQAAIDAAATDATNKANAAEEAAKGHADSLNTAMNARVDALEAIDHEHANKELLDTYTQTEANLADAVAKKHEHANAAELAKIVDGKVAAWDAAEGNAKTYADGLNSAMTTKVDGIAGRLTTVEGAVATKAEQEDLDDAVERITAVEAVAAANASAIAAFQTIPTTDIDALFA